MLRKCSIFSALFIVFTTACLQSAGSASVATSSATTCIGVLQADANCSPTATIAGHFCPQCDSTNSAKWNALQCSGSTGYCWCVDPITGTKTADQQTRNSASLPCATIGVPGTP